VPTAKARDLKRPEESLSLALPFCLPQSVSAAEEGFRIFRKLFSQANERSRGWAAPQVCEWGNRQARLETVR
jgi:hypothetical protein